MRIQMIILALSAQMLLSPIGCGAHHTTTTKTEVHRDSDSDVYHSEEPHVSETTIKETKTEQVSDDGGHHHGIFGILGDIISLPFRAVGAVLTAIF